MRQLLFRFLTIDGIGLVCHYTQGRFILNHLFIHSAKVLSSMLYINIPIVCTQTPESLAQGKWGIKQGFLFLTPEMLMSWLSAGLRQHLQAQVMDRHLVLLYCTQKKEITEPQNSFDWNPIPTVMVRDTFRNPKLLQTPSNLALDTARHPGAATGFLGILSQGLSQALRK